MHIECPLCGEVKQLKGLLFHLRSKHSKELNEMGYQKIKSMGKITEENPKKHSIKPKVPIMAQEPKDEGAIDITQGHEENRAIDAWDQRTRQKIWFSPTPVASAVINQFGSASNPSDVINKSLNEFAASRGIQPAIIKTQGGKSLSLLGGNNEDHEFNNLLKMIQVQNAQNQSFNQNSPTIQMMQLMKEKANKGTSMREMMRDMMKYKMQESISKQNSQMNNPLFMMMLMNRMKKMK